MHHGTVLRILTIVPVDQGLWSLTVRDMEREIIPMCRAEGMGIAPWGVVGQVSPRTSSPLASILTRLHRQGKFKTEAEIAARSGSVRHGTPQTEAEKNVSKVLEKVAAEIGDGATLGAVAVAWVLAKAPYVFPIVGGRSPQQLEEIIKVCLICRACACACVCTCRCRTSC